MNHLHAEPAEQIEITESPAIPTVIRVAEDYPLDEIPTLYDETFSVLPDVLGEHGLAPLGPAVALYRQMPGATVDMEVGFPVAATLGQAVEPKPGIVLAPSELPAGRLARLSHIGSYDGLPDAWTRLIDGIAALGEAPKMPSWELYVTEPSPDADPATMRTDLVVLLE